MRRPTTRGGRPVDGGFTLIEMMIALALIGMALVIAFGALRFAARSWERTDALAGEVEQVRVTYALVRRQLSQAEAVQREPAARALVFQGEARALEFLAPAPSQDGRLAGLYRYRLRFVDTPETHALVMEYRPYFPGPDAGWQAPIETSTLVSEVSSGRFSYRAGVQTEAEEGWAARWETENRLPGLVRLELELEGQSRAWPPQVVPLHVRAGAR